MAFLTGPAARALILWAISAPAFTVGDSPRPEQSPLEYPIKAAFLYNLAKFVEWPPVRDSGPILLGVVGRDAFGVTLEQILQGKNLDGRPLLIRHLARSEELKSCHIVLIAEAEKGRLAEILGSLPDTSSVLTVSEIEGFAQRGGMVYLVIENKKVRFEVNLSTVSRAGLKISARLLQLASVVHDRDRASRR